ncbi:MAG TPA: AsnC family transcriptional regulator [Acidimicrobiaceae bacterium]|nr:AsnC family transcriptional regulator [Acidimicrobiaceae bacterium]
MGSVSAAGDCESCGLAGRLASMTAGSSALDSIDSEILAILRDDARIPYQTLGDRVHLSANAAAERVRKLVRLGVVRRFTVDVDQAVLGRDLEAVIDVRVSDIDRFRRGVLTCPEVTWLAHVTGRTDFQVHASCNGTKGLNDLLQQFTKEFGATETLTTVVLERHR